MNLEENIKFYLNKGYRAVYAESKVVQDLLLSKIAKSNYKNNITIKGGVVMFNITNNKRRATTDIDIDFIRYSIDDESIKILFQKLNNIDNDIRIIVNEIKPLRHLEYKGKRVYIVLKDKFNNEIKSKLDIGVHQNLSIKQEEFVFDFDISKESLKLLINSKEQIFVEKLVSLLIHNIRTTRYKDIFDLYYLCEEEKLDKKLIVELICEYFITNKLDYDISEIKNKINKIFSNYNFRRNIINSKNNWLQIDINIVLDKILDFLSDLEVKL